MACALTPAEDLHQALMLDLSEQPTRIEDLLYRDAGLRHSLTQLDHHREDVLVFFEGLDVLFDLQSASPHASRELICAAREAFWPRELENRFHYCFSHRDPRLGDEVEQLERVRAKYACWLVSCCCHHYHLPLPLLPLTNHYCLPLLLTFTTSAPLLLTTATYLPLLRTTTAYHYYFCTTTDHYNVPLLCRQNS